MGAQKKETRDRFRREVFARAGYRCQGPGCTVASTPDRAVEDLDAHHITDRHAMPGGGYVPENGIALCRRPGGCHEQAEVFHATGTALPGYDGGRPPMPPGPAGWAPADLYEVIGSSHEQAVRASERFLG
jgi:hypothetical protein